MFARTKSLLSTLVGHIDRYNGIQVDANSLPHSIQEFYPLLTSFVTKWASEGRRAVWLRVPTEQAILLPTAISCGFEIHHAEKSYIMLTKWLDLHQEK
jgi:hypothetical protein